MNEMTDTSIAGMIARSISKTWTNPHKKGTNEHVEWAAGFLAMDMQIMSFLDNANEIMVGIKTVRESRQLAGARGK